jgi:hypothetical protein
MPILLPTTIDGDTLLQRCRWEEDIVVVYPRSRILTFRAQPSWISWGKMMPPQMMWTRYFLEAQGYNVEECIFNQDTMSAMILETNGKQSSSKRTKHQGKVFLYQGYSEQWVHHPEALPDG